LDTKQRKEQDYPLWVIPIWNWGGSVVLPLTKTVRAKLGAMRGDVLIARIHGPYLTLRVARPEKVIPVDDFGPEVLPPSWPGKDDNATTPDDTASPAPAAPGTGSDGDTG
jgi:hypothetical protein